MASANPPPIAATSAYAYPPQPPLSCLDFCAGKYPCECYRFYSWWIQEKCTDECLAPHGGHGYHSYGAVVDQDYYYRRPFVDGYINGQYVHMLVDTGYNCNAISIDCARHIGLIKPDEEIEEGSKYILITLLMNNVLVTDHFFIYQHSLHGVVLCAQFFTKLQARFDFAARTITISKEIVRIKSIIEPPAEGNPEYIKQTCIQQTPKTPRPSGMLYKDITRVLPYFHRVGITVKIGGVNVIAGIDTGCDLTGISYNLIKTVGMEDQIQEHILPFAMGIGGHREAQDNPRGAAGNASRGGIYGPHIRVGDFGFCFPIQVLNSYGIYGYEFLIGMNFLSNFRCVLDLADEENSLTFGMVPDYAYCITDFPEPSRHYVLNSSRDRDFLKELKGIDQADSPERLRTPTTPTAPVAFGAPSLIASAPPAREE